MRRTLPLLVALVVSTVVLQVGVPLAGSLNAPQAPPATAGEQGIVTALPATPTQVTETGPTGLQVTVNQTQDLDNQTVSVSWTNGPPTFSGNPSQGFSTSFDGNYVQIFECWSDPLDTQSPGPQPSQCEFGGENVSSSYYPVPDGIGHEYERILSQPGWSTYGQVGGYTDPSTGYEVEPFTAVDGTTVNLSANYNWDLNPNAPQQFWLNPYFSFATTNEIDFARTYANGTGTALFQVDNGLEAPGLGCGQQAADGDTQTPDCWLVVVPRGTPAQENPPGLTGSEIVATSPLTPEAWANRVVIPLQFNPVGTDCNINAVPQQVIGTELASPALQSWEPALCGETGSPDVSYIQDNDDAARLNLTDPTYGSVGMSVFTDPIDPDQLATPSDLVSAPLTLSGAVVAFNIQRVPITEPDGSSNPSELALAGSRIQNIYLTPRLVAKLLTESYESQFRGLRLSEAPTAYQWVKNNPVSIFTDPDFLQYNPEFTLLQTSSLIDAGNMVVEEGSSDAAAALWRWVLADPAARQWLSGTPDPWGMQVNPYYDLNAASNPSGVGFDSPPLETFPKNDPYCDNTGAIVGVGVNAAPARPICIQDWSPYMGSFEAAAQAAASANDGAKTTLNTSASSPDTAWTANGPQLPGQDLIISFTTTTDAAQYGLQTASLSQAGDDGPDPTFIAPTASSMLAAEGSMTPATAGGPLAPNPATTAPGAYPLTMLTYAATDAATLSSASRSTYAALLRYAAGSGQTPGPDPGQLPAGYVPLPSSLAAQTLTAASTIEDWKPPAPTPSSSPPTHTTTTNNNNKALATGSPAAVTDTGPLNEVTTAVAPPITVAQPVPPRPATAQVRRDPPTQLTAVRSPLVLIGGVRWALPLALLVGLVAAAMAAAMGQLRRRQRAGAAAGDAPVAGGADPDGSDGADGG